MKITVFILIALLLAFAIIYLFPFIKGVATSKGAAAPLLPTFICFPKKQFNGQFKNIKNKIANLGGRFYPIPGEKLCFEIIPETYAKIQKLGFEVEILR